MTEQHDGQDLTRLHDLADDLARSIDQANQPLPENLPMDAIASLAEALEQVDRLETDAERQTLVYAQAKLRETRPSLRDGPFAFERAHHALFAEIDTLLEGLPKRELVPLSPSTSEPALVVKREDLASKVEALERRVDLVVDASKQTIVLIDQSKKNEFNLIRLDLEAIIKNVATFKTELLATLIDLRWLVKLTEGIGEITKSLGKSVAHVRKLLSQFVDLKEGLQHVRELSRRVVRGGRTLVRVVRNRLTPKPGPLHRPLEKFRDIDEPWCPEMVVIPAGRFRMGSPKGKSHDDERPQHEVVFAQSFALGRFPVTFEEYDYFCGQTGRREVSDRKWGRGRRPVIVVSWEDAQAYCKWLTEITEQSYRLPSEAEWEYACRASTTTAYAFGDKITEKQANFGQKVKKTTEVGSYPANAWDLHDMHGNVWEWVEDCSNESYEGAPTDGTAWLQGNCDWRVVRGGSWGYLPGDLRSAYRLRILPVIRDYYIGFRVARALTP